jgi:tyrosyl-tRNA synthetase
MADVERITELIMRGAQEVVTEEEARSLAERLAAGDGGKGYIGFEPSGRVHLGWVVVADKIRDLVDAGLDFSILLADWHAMINDKLGGDLEKIRVCGEYMKHCFAALGVPDEGVQYVWAGDLVDSSEYWGTVVKVAKATTLARVRRAMDIMGRSADEGERDFSKFLYPAMQVADIFYLDVDVAFGGMDQRHAHMLARDVAKKLDLKAPVAVHTPLIPALDAKGRMDPIEGKMSKSRPDSGIFVHDEPEEVRRKINKAHCPMGELEDNPVVALLEHVVFPHKRRQAEAGGEGTFVVDRPEKFGGPLSYASFQDAAAAFQAGDLHPKDLKSAVAEAINEVLGGVREYFERNPGPLEQMREVVVTR